MSSIDLDPQVRQFLQGYDLGPISGVRERGGGMFLRPMMIAAGARSVVLRRHSFRSTESSFQFQAESVEFAAGRGVRCARVIPRRDGGFGEAVDGRWWALHDYIEGQPIAWPRWSELKDRPGFMRRLGGKIALLHDALRDARPGGDASLPVECPPVQFDFLPAVRNHWQESMRQLQVAEIPAANSRAALCNNAGVLEDHWRWLEDYWAQHGRDLPRQIVHGDVSPVNMVFAHDSSDEFALIDWDNLHVGLRMYDALGDVQNRAPADLWQTAQLNTQHIGEYLKGYAESTNLPLSAAEQACVPAFCLARHLEDLRQRLHVLSTLPAERDAEYARLIEIRLRFMRQIRELTERNHPWM